MTRRPAVPASAGQMPALYAAGFGALRAVDQGYPVPILLGDLIPRHYVVLLRHDASGATFYEPTIGKIIEVAARDLARGDFSALGYAHLHGAVLPSGPPAT